MMNAICVWVGLLSAGALPPGGAGDPAYYVRKNTWYESLWASMERCAREPGQAGRTTLPNLGTNDFTVGAWISTTAAGGTIFARTPPHGPWAPQGKVLLLRDGTLALDVGWVGAAGGGMRVNDGAWRHVAITGREPLVFYVDGKPVQESRLALGPDVEDHVIKIGYCADNFPDPSGFRGLIDDVVIYRRKLPPGEIERLAAGAAPAPQGLAAHYPFDDSAADASGNGNDGAIRKAEFAAGRRGRALRFDGDGAVTLPASPLESRLAELWPILERDFNTPRDKAQMQREKEDGIWHVGAAPPAPAEFSARYVAACADDAQKEEAAARAAAVKDLEDLWAVRAIYTAPPPMRVPEPIPLDTDPSLVLWWKLDEEEGPRVHDASGHGRHGTLEGSLAAGYKPSRGRFGRALQFDGKGLVTVKGFKGITGTAPRTIAAWVKTAAGGGEIMAWGADEPGQMWTFGYIGRRVGVTPQGGYLYMNALLDNDQWRHVAVVMRPGDPPNLHDHVTLYADGAPAEIHDIGLLDLWPLETGEELDVRVGRGFKGVLDDLRLYNRPLSGDEIHALFTQKFRTVAAE